MHTEHDLRSQLTSSLRAGKTTLIVLGIVEILAGIFAISRPGVATLGVALILSIAIGIAGVARLVSAFQPHRGGSRVVDVLLALVYLAAAVIMFANPVGGALSVTLIVASWCIAEGVLECALALQSPAPPGRGWVLVSGIAGIALGVMIFAGWPSTAVWAVGLLVGVNLLFSGSAALAMGAAMPSNVEGILPPPTPV